MVNVAQIVTEVSVERSSLVGRPTVRLQHRKRDPGIDRALAWKTASREVHRAALSHREGGGSQRPRDLRELPFDGILAAPVPRLRVLQRVPGIPTVPRGLPRATAQPER